MKHSLIKIPPNSNDELLSGVGAKEELPVERSSELPTKAPNSAKVAVSWWILLLRSCQRRGVIVVFCSSGLFMGSTAINSVLQSVKPSLSSAQQLVSQADYERLEVGMTVTEAQAALGRSIEVSRDETTTTHKWVNNDGSAITAVFKNNRLSSKEQSGLQQ